MDVPVFTVTDSVAEGNENFLLQITGVTGPASVGTQSETNITIVDITCKLLIWKCRKIQLYIT